jgi:hypothetical protein
LDDNGRPFLDKDGNFVGSNPDDPNSFPEIATPATGGGVLDSCEGEIIDRDQCEAACREDSFHWYCRKMEKLFARADRLGLQPDRTKDSLTSTEIQKIETATGISTTSTVRVNERVARTLLTHQIGDESGNVQEDVMTSPLKDDTKTTTWETAW